MQNLREHSLDEVGKTFGLTRERIRQLEKEALIQIRLYLGEEGKQMY